MPTHVLEIETDTDADTDTAAARAALDPGTFAAAWTAGCVVSLERAVAEARDVAGQRGAAGGDGGWGRRTASVPGATSPAGAARSCGGGGRRR